MQKQNRLFIISTAVLVLVFVLSMMGGSASASSPNAPRTKTPTPSPTSSGPTPTAGPTQTPGPAPTISSTDLTNGWSLISAYNITNLIHAGAANAVALLVTPPAHSCNDLSFCTVDWNPEALDMNAGIWGK